MLCEFFFNFYFILFSLLECNCFTMLCQFLRYNKVNQLYVNIYPIPLEPPYDPHIPPLWVITEHRTELPVLYSSFPLASYFTHGSVYKSMLLSQFIPYPVPPIYIGKSRSFTFPQSLRSAYQKSTKRKTKKMHKCKINLRRITIFSLTKLSPSATVAHFLTVCPLRKFQNSLHKSYTCFCRLTPK